MIGVFDSGLGGVLSASYVHTLFPRYDLFVFADSAHVPYGTKDPQRVCQRTFACLDRMFAQGCDIVIMACNTASAVAIRAWQATFPDKKVLSITIPAIEAIAREQLERCVVLATKTTVDVHLYSTVYHDHFPHQPCIFHELCGVDIVDILEDELLSVDERYARLKPLCEGIIHGLPPAFSNAPLVLGCTHYPLVENFLARPGCMIINPSLEAAQALRGYIRDHPRYFKRGSGLVHIRTTGPIGLFRVRIDTLVEPIVGLGEYHIEHVKHVEI